jgi:NTE family protein
MNDGKLQDLCDFLNRVPLFSSIPEEQIREIAGQCELIFLEKGQAVFEEGDAGDAMYIVKSGSVGVYNTTGESEAFVAALHRGDFFGEMALLTGKPRSATIRVLLDAHLYRFTKISFDLLLRQNPSLGLYLSRLYAHRFAESSDALLGEQPPCLFALLATHPGLGRSHFLYSLAYHIAREARQSVLLVELERDTADRPKRYEAQPSACPYPDLFDTFSSRYREPLQSAWFAHPEGFHVFTLPFVRDGRYWQELDTELTLVLDILRQRYDKVLFNIPIPATPVGKRVLRLCDRTLLLINNTPEALVEVQRRLNEVAAICGNRRDHVRVGVSHLVGERGIARAQLASHLNLPEAPAIWVPRNRHTLHHAIDKETGYPVRGPRALARELGGVRVGLALGAGGARGWAHLGVLRVLEQEGIPIDMVAGTSIGALVGCLYAHSASGKETLDLVRTTLPSKLQVQRRIFDYTLPLRGIIRGAKLLRMIREAIQDADFLDLRLPFYVVTVDYHTGEEIVLHQGNVAEAVRASLSIPGVMNPARLNGRWLLDGGLLNPVPVDVLLQKGADTIIAVCVERGKHHISRTRSRSPGLMSVLTRTMNIIHGQATRDFAHKADVVLYPDVEQYSWDAFHRVQELATAGAEACRSRLDEIRALTAT